MVYLQIAFFSPCVTAPDTFGFDPEAETLCFPPARALINRFAGLVNKFRQEKPMTQLIRHVGLPLQNGGARGARASREERDLSRNTNERSWATARFREISYLHRCPVKNSAKLRSVIQLRCSNTGFSFPTMWMSFTRSNEWNIHAPGYDSLISKMSVLAHYMG